MTQEARELVRDLLSGGAVFAVIASGQKTMNPEIAGHMEARFTEAATTITTLLGKMEEARVALDKIDAIRNSIIGFQNVGWSEHIYPLVAALGEAGYQGAGYEKARESVRTLLAAEARAEAAEARADKLAAALRGAKVALVEAAIPLEAIVASGKGPLSLAIYEGACNAVSHVRSFLNRQGVEVADGVGK